MASEPGDEDDRDGDRDNFARKLSDQILSRMLESGAALKRGQDRLGGLAQATKDELVKRVGTEVRGFLEKMDVVDLAQQVVSGLVIEMKTEIRFRHDEDGNLAPELSNPEIQLKDADDPATDKSKAKPKPEKS